MKQFNATEWIQSDCFSWRGAGNVRWEVLANILVWDSGLILSRTPGGLPWWLRQSRICLQCRRPSFDPWVRKIPWRGEWLPTPVLLPGESHEQRSLAGYSLWGFQRVKKNWVANTFTFLLSGHLTSNSLINRSYHNSTISWFWCNKQNFKTLLC